MENSMKLNVFKWLFSGYINKKVMNLWVGQPRAIQGSVDRLTSDEIQEILTRTWKIYFLKAQSLPKQPRVRLWLVMNFAALTLSAQHAMVGLGIEKDYAIDLIYDLVWDVTAGSTKTANRFTNLAVKNTMRRLEVLVDLVMKVVFCPPAYQIQKGKLDDGFFMDVQTCPVADYMISNQASDLCINTWCKVDFGLVEIIGGRLERSGTLSMGREKCDFHFYEAA